MSTYTYNPLDLVCAAHNVQFVKYKSMMKHQWGISHGCPVCVGLIRAKVQLELHRDSVITKVRDGRLIEGRVGGGRRKVISNAKSQQVSSKASIASNAIDNGTQL
jgi:hypothetical protein